MFWLFRRDLILVNSRRSFISPPTFPVTFVFVGKILGKKEKVEETTNAIRGFLIPSRWLLFGSEKSFLFICFLHPMKVMSKLV